MERRLRDLLPTEGFGNVSKARSRTMSAIKGRGNKTTEQRLRFALVRAGIVGWTLHDRGLPGCPDFVFEQRKLAVFVDGCFWHGCARCGHEPKTNGSFWSTKIALNKSRDRKTTNRLRGLGFVVIRIWEHELVNNTSCVLGRIKGCISL